MLFYTKLPGITCVIIRAKFLPEITFLFLWGVSGFLLGLENIQMLCTYSSFQLIKPHGQAKKFVTLILKGS